MYADPQAQWILWIGAWSTTTVAFWFYVIARRRLEGVRRLKIRYRLFAIRDRLYLCAANKDIPVASEGFGFLRNMLCQLIRYEEHWGAYEYAQLYSQTRESEVEGVSTFTRMLEQLPDGDARQAFVEMNIAATECFSELIQLNSRVARILAFLRKTQVGQQRLIEQQQAETQIERLRSFAGGGAAHA